MKILPKLLFTIILESMCLSIIAQDSGLPRNPETNMIEYSEVIQVDSTLSQSDLYLRAKGWFAKTFSSANAVIQMDDKEGGIIIGKSIIPINGGTYLADGKVDFTIKVQVKKGRYKYWFNNFSHSSYKSGYSGGVLESPKPACGGFFMVKKGWEQVKGTTEKNVKLMVISLGNVMNKKSADVEEENW